jgi:ATP-dependent RNA helicase DDX42
VADDEDGDVEYDADGNPIAPVRSKFIDPLPPIDHSLIAYKPFEKNFYVEHTDIAGLSPIQVRNFFYCHTGVWFLPNSIIK